MAFDCQEFGVFPFSPRKMVYTLAFSCSVTSGSGDRLRKEGCRSGGVYSFSPSLGLVGRLYDSLSKHLAAQGEARRDTHKKVTNHIN